MLTATNGNQVTITCNNCKAENTYDLSNVTSGYLTEFGEYENLPFSCPNCGNLEIFNMNIPLDPLDDEIQNSDMPVNEEVQRYYVRLLIQTVREDFKKLVV